MILLHKRKLILFLLFCTSQCALSQKDSTCLSTELVFAKKNSSRRPGIVCLSTISKHKDPLIILDNFPFEGNINDIKPKKIKSIQILKDSVAASIWGVRADNGVIMITTKKWERKLKKEKHKDVRSP